MAINMARAVLMKNIMKSVLTAISKLDNTSAIPVGAGPVLQAGRFINVRLAHKHAHNGIITSKA